MKKLIVEVWKSRRDHQWYFHIKSGNGKIIASSEGYKKKSGAWKTARIFSGHPSLVTTRLIEWDVSLE